MAIALDGSGPPRRGRTRAPDEAARFERFDRRHRPRVRMLATQYVAEHQADDLTQETLWRAYRHGLHLEDDRDAWPWLARVARNLATDDARRRGRVETVTLEGDPAGPTAPTSPPTGAAADALTALPGRARRMLVDQAVHGYRYTDIANREGVSEAAVRSVLFRARHALRSHYRHLGSPSTRAPSPWG